MSIIKRDFCANRIEAYIYKNTCLLKSITVKRPKEMRKLCIRINGIDIQPTYTTNEKYIFDFAKIRKSIRDNIFTATTQHDNELIQLEEMFSFNALQAAQYYSKLNTNILLDDTIFTSALQIAFVPTISYPPKTIEFTEEVYESDILANKK